MGVVIRLASGEAILDGAGEAEEVEPQLAVSSAHSARKIDHAIAENSLITAYPALHVSLRSIGPRRNVCRSGLPELQVLLWWVASLRGPIH